MTNETAKQLAEAINRLAAALERLPISPLGGIQVQHHGMASGNPNQGPNYEILRYAPNQDQSRT